MLILSKARIGLLSSTYLAVGRGPAPAMSLDFLSGTLDPRITFSRGSNATLVDSTGKITYAPNNLLTYSAQFDNAAWLKTRATVSADAAAAPNGTVTADKLVEDTTAANNHTISRILGNPLAAGNYIYSICLKQSGRRYAQLMVFVNPASTNLRYAVVFDLQDGVITSTAASTPAPASVSSSMQSVGNGWYICSIVFANPTGLRADTQLATSTSATATIATQATNGDGTSGVLVWGAQLEAVTYQTTPSAYVATTSAAYYGPRFDFDPDTLAAKGLLVEEARTNLVTYSEQFDNAIWGSNNTGGVGAAPVVTANAGTAPDGTSTADRLQLNLNGGTTSSDISRRRQVVTVAAGPQTFSFWAKSYDGISTYDLVRDTSAGGTDPFTVTGIWQRFIVTSTYGAGAAGFGLGLRGGQTPVNPNTADILVWGAQVEAGSFATSYIPTVASQVTRTADVATMTGANFSSWYNQNEGTFIVKADYLNTLNVAWVLAAHSGSAATTNDYTAIVKNSSAINRQTIVASGVSQGAIDFAGALAGPVYTLAGAYKTNDAAFTVNGATPLTDTTVTLPTPTALAIGNLFSQYISGHIRSIGYYNTRLPNLQLQALTQ